MSGRRAKQLRHHIAATYTATEHGWRRTAKGPVVCIGLRAAYRSLKRQWKERAHAAIAAA